MLLLWIFLVTVVAMLLSFGLALWTAMRWGREWQELKACGIEVTGRVIEKRQVRSTRHRSTHIRYEYVDQFGKTRRSRRNLVTEEAWAAHEEGGPIQVIYSEKNPQRL